MFPKRQTSVALLELGPCLSLGAYLGRGKTWKLIWVKRIHYHLFQHSFGLLGCMYPLSYHRDINFKQISYMEKTRARAKNP